MNATPDIIEAIVDLVIFSDEPRIERLATFDSLTRVSKDWSAEARRLELLRLDISGAEQMRRLISRLKFLRDPKDQESGSRRACTRSMTVFFDIKADGGSDIVWDLLGEAFSLLDLSGLQDLDIRTETPNVIGPQLRSLLPPNQGRILPELRRFSAGGLTSQRISEILSASDPNRLEKITSIEGTVISALFPEGAVSFPNLKSLDIISGITDCAALCGSTEVDASKVAPSIERIRVHRPIISGEWPKVEDWLKSYAPPKLEYFEISVFQRSNFLPELPSTVTALAKEKNCTMWITWSCAGQFTFSFRFLVKPGAEPLIVNGQSVPGSVVFGI